MNSMQLKAKLRNVSKERHVDFNTLLRLYMYDRFIERLAISKYKDNFILKGGFYLSTLFGIENRTTMDIDTTFKNAKFDEQTIVIMINEIVSLELNDNAKLFYLGITSIRDEDEYGGFRVDIQVELENIKERFHIDIATGDPITPKEIRYKYKPILGIKPINLWAYNVETVLAEKIETILSRSELNGRMRDFYDIYLIYTKEWENININKFRRAINMTFSKREYNGNPFETISLLKRSELLKSKWNIYQRKYDYARNVDFNDIMNYLERMMIEVETIMV